MYNSDMYINKVEIDNRVEKLQKILKKWEIDGTFIIQRSDLLYFSGTVQNAYLYISVSGKPLLMVYRDFSRAKSDSHIEMVPMDNKKSVLDILQDYGFDFPQKLGLEMDVIPANLYLSLKNQF